MKKNMQKLCDELGVILAKTLEKNKRSVEDKFWREHGVVFERKRQRRPLPVGKKLARKLPQLFPEA